MSDGIVVNSKQRKVKKRTGKVSSNWLQLAKTTKVTGKRKRLPLPGDENKAKKSKTTTELPAITTDDKSITKYLGLDCEMVGVGDGEENALAQVVIVNSYGNIIYNKYVKSSERVVDFRTNISGIRPEHIANAPSFDDVQKEVSEIIAGKIVVGHGLENDFKALLLSHPFGMTRDTAKYRPLQRKKNKPHSLKWLARTHLGIEIQTGEHSPDIDARAALLLYNKFKREWEAYLKTKRKKKYTAPRKSQDQ
uniref:RNA exonuclease 4 n=1 Tax=Vannella robusta TaxID=1487602 RepID=A0A7S4I7Z3_9EUKA|mmetsp:Transcript_21786/g.27765  ORF Transcript_21786/g.27765 Transcript_21786/m.27765 type:complete len:250 (+) Transcript_21786:160-909(+)